MTHIMTDMMTHIIIDIKLKLIHSMSSESQILQPKMKCNCSEEFIKKIASTLRFDIDRYLFDNV